jgi:hypothetical protein
MWITSWAPGLLTFVVGVLVILLAFNLVDHALPELKLTGTADAYYSSTLEL